MSAHLTGCDRGRASEFLELVLQLFVGHLERIFFNLSGVNLLKKVRRDDTIGLDSLQVGPLRRRLHLRQRVPQRVEQWVVVPAPDFRLLEVAALRSLASPVTLCQHPADADLEFADVGYACRHPKSMFGRRTRHSAQAPHPAQSQARSNWPRWPHRRDDRGRRGPLRP